jgi:quercetin dioxygenase-like cupin family protein
MIIRMNWFHPLLLGLITLWITGMSTAQTAASGRSPVNVGPADEVIYFAAAKVNASFEKGATLVGGTNNVPYRVLTARHDKPGQAELHAKYTDVIYVVEGTATFVTGGEVLGGKTTAPGEIRGASIKGGTSRKLTKGDVIIVPIDTPHQFVRVSNPFLYLIVKVR